MTIEEAALSLHRNGVSRFCIGQTVTGGGKSPVTTVYRAQSGHHADVFDTVEDAFNADMEWNGRTTCQKS